MPGEALLNREVIGYNRSPNCPGSLLSAMESITLFLPQATPQYSTDLFQAITPPTELQVSSVGESYERQVRLLLGIDPPLRLSWGSTTQRTGSTNATDGDLDENDEESAKYSTHKKLVKLDEDDYYDLLGLTQNRWLSSQDEIKAAYRKAVLKYHPDKQAQGEAPVNDEVFKKLQNAYEHLSNPKKKRAYDSKDPFDDTIPDPSQVTTPESFFEIYGPAFERNSKWSAMSKTPKLGDMNSSWNNVNAFYNAWFHFKTWRDFSYLDEYDPDDAGSRDERRWMERRNAKERSKRDRAEAARVYSLVQSAHSVDPRVIARKKQEEEQRQREKQEKQEIYRQKREEEERKRLQKLKEEEEKIAKEREAEELARAEQTRIARAKRECVQRIRDAIYAISLGEDTVEYIAARYDLEQLSSLRDKLNDVSSEDPLSAYKAIIEGVIAELKERANRLQKQSAPAPASSETAVSWSADEVSTLAKAVVKFPGGTRDRWEKIQKWMNTDKTVKQIIARVKNTSGSPGPSATQLTQKFEQWQSTKLKELEKKGNPELSGPSTNWEAQVVAAQDSSSAPVSKVPATTPAPPTVWSQDDQNSLEAALKKFPSSLGPERWTKIAEAVPGKSKKDCVERYKYLVSIVKQSAVKK